MRIPDKEVFGKSLHMSLILFRNLRAQIRGCLSRRVPPRFDPRK